MDRLRHRLGPLVACAVAVTVVAAGAARADYVPGAVDSLREAEAALLARVEPAGQQGAVSLPNGRRLRVLEVLTGLWWEQTIEVDAPLTPGQRVVLLVQPRELRNHPELAVTPPPKRQVPLLWPLGPGDTLPRDVVARGDDGHIVFRNQRTPLTLVALRALITTELPDDAGLQQRVLALVLPRVGQPPPLRDPGARIVAALSDVGRDVPALAALLESPDSVLRTAVAARLQGITGVALAAPPEALEPALADWHTAWTRWWEQQRLALRWDEGRSAWVPRQADDPPARAWPPVPMPLRAPVVSRSLTLVRLLEGTDPVLFEAAIRAWLDSGIVRDRDLRGATTTDTSAWPGADIGGVRYSDPVALPLLHSILDPARPLAERLTALASRVMHAHADRFSVERAESATALGHAPPCAEIVRRAAYWELVNNYTPGPAQAALARLSLCPDSRAAELLEIFYQLRPDDPVVTAVSARLKAGDPRFRERLVRWVRTRGAQAGWATRVLVENGDSEALPLALAWLRSGESARRLHAADTLCRLADRSAVPALVAAVRSEGDADVRGLELTALAAVADARALEVLLALARSTQRPGARIAIANGLGRIKDARALTALAGLALGASPTELQVAQEAVNSFGWISGLLPAFPPADNPGGSVDPARITAGLATIGRWQAARKP